MGVAVFPLSTGVTYALIPRTKADGLVLHSMGYGRTDASDGRVFSHVFTAPMTYWSQVTSITKYIGEQLGGMNNLKGKKIALVYHNSAYGKEPIKTLEVLSAKYGFKFLKYPVNHPGLEQKSTWLKIGRQTKPDFTIIFGWGVMTQTSIKEAKANGYPVSKIIGNWWSGSENDTRPAGSASVGYKAAGFHTIGKEYPLHRGILDKVYAAGKGSGEKSVVGEVLYNRALVQGVIFTEAIRAAHKKYGNIAINGKQLAWGYEHVNLTAARLEELGLGGFMKPLKITCANHEGENNLLIHEWDGNNWINPSKWYKPMYDVTRPMIEASAAAYAKEKGITPRSNCN
jgi:branched-chain amino acid transport system substrate-binding protein